MADTYPVKTEPLAVIKTPSLPTTGQVGMKDVLGIQEPYLKEKARLIPEISAARGRAKEAEQEQQVIEAEGNVAATRGFAEAEKGAMQQYSTKLEKEPLPAFVPSKENADDLATLFSLVSVIGMVVGGGGKQNAQQAMSAMNGMLEGHQKGRADLYRQELSTFDKSFKSMVQKHAEFRKEMEDAVKLASTDKEAAMSNAKLAATKAGSTVVNAMLDQGRLLDSYKFVDESQAGVNKAVEAEAKLRADAAKEAAAERRQRQTMEQAERLARIRAEGSGASTPSGKGGAVQFRYNQAMTNAGNQLANEIENAASLPISATPPVLAEVLTDPTKGLSDAGKRFFSQKITDEEARAFQQVFAGMTRAITTIEASGRPSGATEGAIREFSKSQPRAGDKKINIYLSLAQSKQVMDILVKDLKAAEANSTQIAQAEEAKKRVDSFITWTVRDVNRIISSGARTLVDPQVQNALGTSQNLNEFNKQVGPRVSKDYATEADAEKAFKAGTLKSGEKVNIGGVFGTWE